MASRSIPAIGLIALAAAISAGCTYERVEPDPAPLDPALAPCPSRLHDIAGAILLHYVARQTMPPDLAAIQLAGGDSCPPLQCPVSGKPYVYNPDGLEVPGQVGRVVLYDATPVHDGRRWALVVAQTSPTVALEVRVVLLPKGAPISASSDIPPPK